MSDEKKSSESGSGIPIMKREKSDVNKMVSGIKPPSVISVASSGSSSGPGSKTIRSCCSSTPKAGPPPIQRGKFQRSNSSEKLHLWQALCQCVR